MTYIGAVRVVNLSSRALLLAVNDLRDSRRRRFTGRPAGRLGPRGCRRKAAAALHNNSELARATDAAPR